MVPMIPVIFLYLVVAHFVLSVKIDWITVMGNLFFLQGIFVDPLMSPFWILPYQVFFYIFLGAFAVLCLTRHSEFRKAYLAFIVLIICILAFTKLTGTFLLFVFLVGMLGHVVQPKFHSKLLTFIFLVFIILSLVLLQLSTDTVSVSNSAFHNLDRRTLSIVFSLFCCLFIQQIVLFKPQNAFLIIVDNIGTKFAAFSFTLYLVHRVIFLILFKYGFPKNCGTFNLQSILLYIEFLFIVIIAAYLIYIPFERNTDFVQRYIKNKFKDNYVP
jgi:hypothetical protein